MKRCILIVGLIILANILYIKCSNDNSNFTFMKERWRRNPDYRFMMVDNLLESGRLDTLDRESIRTLLGNPRREEYNYMSYPIGRPKGKIKFVEPQYLMIKMQENTPQKSYVSKLAHIKG